MKKIVYSLVLMLLLSTKVNAQLTPEGVMATLPDMPTAAQMITIETSEQEPDLYVDFHAKLNDAQQKCQEMMDKTTASLAKEVSETEKSLDTDICRGVYLYVGDNVDVVTDKSFGDFSCIYQHDGVWYRLDASHKVQHDDFVKEYPEKYYGVKLYVHGKYNVTQ